ncbi:hypothetical protein [Sphingomonas faeni]|uniref:hypothetical protein n=1 Tax=Sphingomonas faeni TaxID=185950 RepID=UPI0027842943|nr:hypothetical protein [Sphingomonas faeni]MDQ0839397.1 hypothetical protein [Sphingomonas faeni]
MTPANDRWAAAMFGLDAAGIVAAQKGWRELNLAIAGEGPAPIVGVDGRIVSHTDQMAYPPEILSRDYDSGDHIHPTNFGRRVNAYSWRRQLVDDGLLA